MQALFLLLAILAGAVVPEQFAVKSELRRAVGGDDNDCADLLPRGHGRP